MQRVDRATRQRLQKRAISRILVVVFFGFGILIAAFYVFLSVFLKKSWTTTGDKNIILIPQEKNGYSGNLLFAHISPISHKMQIVLLNSELPVTVVGEEGQDPLRSVYAFWKIKKGTAQSLPATYSMALGTVVDQVWASDQTHFNPTQFDLNQLVQNVLFFKIDAPLTMGDRIWLYTFVHSLGAGDITVTTASTVSEWQKNLANLSYASPNQHCSVAVINTIAVSGAGAHLGNLFQSSGLPVVRITDEQPSQVQSQLIVGTSEETCRDQQSQILAAMPVQLKVIQDKNRATQYRANLVLIIGGDLKPFLQTTLPKLVN